MRIFTASLATETNTFSPVPTDRASFDMAFYAGPGKHPETPTLCSSPIVALRKRAAQEGLTVIEGTRCDEITRTLDCAETIGAEAALVDSNPHERQHTLGNIELAPTRMPRTAHPARADE